MLTVQEVISATDKDLPGKGWFTSYKLVLQSGETAELFQRKDSVPPKAGDQIDGTLEQSQYGLKIKKNAKLTGPGGPRQRDPRETAAIQRQHSQGMAVQVAVAAGWFKQDWNPHNEQDAATLKDLARLTDWFQRDIQRGVNLEMYGSKRDETRKEPVRTGESDVPSDTTGFEHPKTDLQGTPFAV
jgi:hypothetical protein